MKIISYFLLTTLLLLSIYIDKPFGLTENDMFRFWVIFILSAMRLDQHKEKQQ